MAVNLKQLHYLLDNVDPAEYDILSKILLKFIPEVELTYYQLVFSLHHLREGTKRVIAIAQKRKMNNIDIMFNITYNNIEPLL